MADYDPYRAAAEATSARERDFDPKDLYDLDDFADRSAHASAQPSSSSASSAASSLAQQPPAPSSPGSQRRRLTKSRPTSLLVGPRHPSQHGRKGSSAGASPLVASPLALSPGTATLFRAPSSGAPSPAAAGGTTFRIPASEFAPRPMTQYTLSGGGDSADAYSLPPTAAEDTAFLLEAKAGADWDERRGSPGALPPKRASGYFDGGRPPLPPPAQRRGARWFEPPHWKQLLLHAVICLAAWPAIYFVLPLVKGSLFWTRAFVAVGCSVVGLLIGWSLLCLGRKWLESAAWATVVHQSAAKDDGIKLRDIANTTFDSASSWAALRLLWNRWAYPGTGRGARRSFDKRPWTLFILFFLWILAVAASMSFVLGRIVNIETSVLPQDKTYREIAVAGDLSAGDIANAAAQVHAFAAFVQTWTLAPFASPGSQAQAVDFAWEDEKNVTDRVYFAETAAAQLRPQGAAGMGTFQQNSTTSGGVRVARRDTLLTGAGVSNLKTTLGSVLRYPKWGIRIHCEKLPNLQWNIMPLSPDGFTYVFLPNDLLSRLFSSFGLSLPNQFMQWTVSNSSAVLSENDSFPIGSDPQSWGRAGKFWNNGVAHSLWSIPTDMGEGGGGWTEVEIVLVRLNTSYVPRGSFPLYSNESIPDASGTQTRIGYDAAVCVELYEPWIVDVYNGTGLPQTQGIRGPGSAMRDALGVARKGPALAGVTRALNSTGKTAPFEVAHDNAVNQIIKDNGRDVWYVPSPTVVSFTSGAGPEGYTALDAGAFGAARARADAGNVLPFLAGTGPLLARQYDEETLAWTRVDGRQLAALLGGVLLLGWLAGLAVPALPGGVPRREFGMWGWVAALLGDGLLAREAVEAKEVCREMEVEEVEKRMGELRVRYLA